jgi:hypothetical protein
MKKDIKYKNKEAINVPIKQDVIERKIDYTDPDSINEFIKR